MIFRLKAGVLSFVIYVSIIVSVMLLTMILYGYYTRTENVRYRIGIRLLDNLASAEQWALGSGDKLNYLSQQTWDLYGAGYDSVTVVKFPWGIFDGYQCAAFYNRFQQRSYFLSGSRLNEYGRSSIYLIDEGRPLSVVGSTRIEGVSYLPLAGVKSAFINRQGYSGESLTFGETRRSDNTLPKLESFEVYKEFESFVDKVHSIPDLGQKTNQSFQSDTLVHIELGNAVISDSLTGFVFLESSGRLVFDSTSHTDQIVVQADIIEFRSGFNGQGQFFARDSIIVHEKVKLDYPSVLAIESDLHDAQILVSKGAEVNGFILMDGSDGNARDRKIKIEKEGKVTGMIYCHGYLESFGEVDGHVLAKRFLINSFSGVYENYILNATYKFGLDTAYLQPRGWFMSNEKGVVEWLD